MNAQKKSLLFMVEAWFWRSNYLEKLHVLHFKLLNGWFLIRLPVTFTTILEKVAVTMQVKDVEITHVPPAGLK